MSEKSIPVYGFSLTSDLLPEFEVKQGDRITIERNDGTKLSGVVLNIARVAEFPAEGPHPPPLTTIQLGVDQLTSSRIR